MTTDGIGSALHIAHCYFSNNKGSAIFINSASIIVTITDTIITQNEGGLILDDTPLFSKDVIIIIKDSIFQENTGASLGLTVLHPVNTKKIDIVLENTLFFNNTNLMPTGGIIQVDGRISLSIKDACVFKGNHGSSIQALTTNVRLSGVVIFEDNIAFQGGAISLSYSMLKFQLLNDTKTTILFVNNSAKNAGGGIYVDRSLSIDDYSGSKVLL